MSRTPAKPFSHPMRKSEIIFGWIFLPVFVLLLPRATAFFCIRVLVRYWPGLDSAHLNFLFFALGFVILTVCMFSFLRESFHDLLDNLLNTVKALFICFVLYYLLLYVVNLLCILTVGDAINPNEENVRAAAELNSNVMLAVAVIIGPIVEETLFRGVVFGSIRRKNRLLAYAVSCLLFSLYHIWQYFPDSFDWMYLMYLLQYIPGGICLAMAYERGGSIWSSIMLHSLINFISMQAMSL
ncbi:MAG: CPBP family intramembrane metalloprotease [Oscillospiraceae bacterium]|nr:CPBP family intramembrane metalloprotease [Oscillospiraceae bacterium]